MKDVYLTRSGVDRRGPGNSSGTVHRNYVDGGDRVSGTDQSGMKYVGVGALVQSPWGSVEVPWDGKGPEFWKEVEGMYKKIFGSPDGERG